MGQVAPVDRVVTAATAHREERADMAPIAPVRRAMAAMADPPGAAAKVETAGLAEPAVTAGMAAASSSPSHPTLREQSLITSLAAISASGVAPARLVFPEFRDHRAPEVMLELTPVVLRLRDRRAPLVHLKVISGVVIQEQPEGMEVQARMVRAP